MAARDVALEHHRERAALAAAAEHAAADMWAQVDPGDISASWARQVPSLTAATTAAQQAAAGGADAYVAEALAEQGLDPTSVGRLNPRSLAGVASDGRGLASLLGQPGISALTAIGGGATVEQAMATGLASARMIAATQVADAGRAADGVALTARPAAGGYTRIVVGRTCSRCTILAGKFYRWNAGFDRHPKCDCIHLPTVQAQAAGIRQNPRQVFESLSRAEQDRVYTKAGAQAIREGADMGQVVNVRKGMYTAGGQKLTRASAGRRPRLMPEEIYRQARGDRDEAIRLLRQHGYLSAPASRPAATARPKADLSKLTVVNLRAMAKERGLTGLSRARKADLIAALDGSAVKVATRLEAMTVAQLRAEAQRLGVKVPSKARKADIVELLRRPGAGTATKTATGAVDISKMTVAQLKALAKELGVKVPSGLAKADIVANLRSWDIGNGRKLFGAPAKAKADDPFPFHPPAKGSRNPAELTGGQHGWGDLLREDTGMAPIRIRDLEVPGAGGYVIRAGSAFRIDGVVYLIEHDATRIASEIFGALTREQIVETLRAAHVLLPLGSTYQRGYAWLAGRNPADDYWAKKYNTPGFRSAATGGDGGVRFWGHSGGSGIHSVAGTISHEFGHNVSGAMAGRGLHDHGSAWARAVDSDLRTRRPTDLHLDTAPGRWPIDFNYQTSKGFPAGVTEYGKSSVAEDYAESMYYYLAGPIGRGRLKPGGPLVPIYFRDLFPARAAVLDDALPAVAKQQRARIASGR